MKNIIALIDENTNRDVIINSAVEFAKLLKLEITVCHFVVAPHNWEQLGRRARDKFIEAKQKINEARIVMDEILSEIRSEDLKVKKRFIYYDQTDFQTDFGFSSDDLIIVEKSLFNRSTNNSLSDILLNVEASKLILNTFFDTQAISDIVFTSNFQHVKKQSVDLINDFYKDLKFNLNLVFINTKEIQENSDISIQNMKSVIAENGFSRTKISIFNAESRMTGANLYANMKDGDLIIMECSEQINRQELENQQLPILLIIKVQQV